MKVAFAIAVLALCVLSVSAGCPGADSWKKVLSKAAAGKFMFVEVDNSIELVSTDALTLAAERAKKPAPVGSKKPTAPPSSKKPSTGSSSKSGSTADKPGKISFEPHVSGKKDSATSKQNVVDASNGVEVSRSSYQNAPGGKVCMAEKVAQLLLKLLEKGDVRISELAGGSHSATSGHYAGNSVDITSFKGEYLTKSAKNVKAVIDTCKSLGSTAIYHASLGKDKTNAEHKTHVHCQFGPNFKPERKKAGSSSSSSKPSSKKPAPNRAKKPRAKK